MTNYYQLDFLDKELFSGDRQSHQVFVFRIRKKVPIVFLNCFLLIFTA